MKVKLSEYENNPTKRNDPRKKYAEKNAACVNEESWYSPILI